jgi:hypothetical protein
MSYTATFNLVEQLARLVPHGEIQDETAYVMDPHDAVVTLSSFIAKARSTVYHLDGAASPEELDAARASLTEDNIKVDDDALASREDAGDITWVQAWVEIETVEYLIASDTEWGYWSSEHGWVYDVDSAERFAYGPISMSTTIPDARLVPVGLATDYDPYKEPARRTA